MIRYSVSLFTIGILWCAPVFATGMGQSCFSLFSTEPVVKRTEHQMTIDSINHFFTMYERGEVFWGSQVLKDALKRSFDLNKLDREKGAKIIVVKFENPEQFGQFSEEVVSGYKSLVIYKDQVFLDTGMSVELGFFMNVFKPEILLEVPLAWIVEGSM